MPRYLEIARQAGEMVGAILSTVPEAQRPQLAVSLAKLYNLGIRTSPRACQSTVRINAVSAAMRGHGVKVGSKQVPVAPGATKTFTVLTLTPEGGTAPADVEGDAGDDGGD